MCIRPIFVRIRQRNPYSQRISLDELGKSDFKVHSNTLLSYTGFDYHQVPCGRCIECCRNRQSQHAFKLYKRVEKCSYMYHLTLTYAPEHLPFSCVYNIVDRETGEIFRESSYMFLNEDSELLSYARSLVPKDNKSILPFYFASYIETLGGFDYERLVTPSLNRQDVRSALKVCRILYKRRHGCYPRFHYSFCGEYGPKTNRPHYHIVFASSDDINEFVYLFKEYWQNKFGYTVLKRVRRINKDGTDGYAIAARYLSKYISKGEYECHSVREGCAEKGRVCQSCHLDSDPIDIIKPYHLAYDLYGPYDFNTFTLDYKQGEIPVKLTPEQIRNIVSVVRERYFVKFGNSQISLPRYLKERLFYYTDIYGNKKRSKLSFLVSDSIQKFYDKRETSRLDSKIKFFKKSGASNPEGLACLDTSKAYFSSASIREARFKKNYEAFLSSSKSPL